MAGTDHSREPITGGPAIILVNPQLGENIGTAARAMLNCGLDDLRLVAPRDGWPNDKAVAAASGADAVLNNARLYPNVRAAIGDLAHVYASTARDRYMVNRIVTAHQAAGEMRGRIGAGESCGVLFGPERTGLVNDDVALADTVLTVPLNPAFSSLNLAQAVLVVGYEWFAAADGTRPEMLYTGGSRPANKAELQRFFDHFEEELEASGFIRHPDKRPSMVRNLRNFFQRATPTEQELRTLHGVITAFMGPRDRDKPDRDKPDRDKGLMRRTAAVFAALIALCCVPLFSTVLPPLVDLPNHLARMHLLAEGGNPYYAVHWAPLPNLAADAVIPVLARVMPLMLAGKIFLVSIFVLLAGGTVWLNRIVAGRCRLWPMLAFLFLYNRILLWGFVNDLFGLGVALCGLALWLELELRPTALRIAASCVVALACFFSHLVAFGVYALMIAGVELVPAWGELRRRQWTPLAGRVGVAAAQFVIPVAVFLAWWEPGAGGTVSYAAFLRKFDLLFSVFDNYSRVFDVACFVLMVLALVMLAATRRLNLAPRMAGALGLVFIAYLALPSELLSGTGADHRLPLALFLLLIAGSAPRLGRREAVIAGSAAVAMFLVRLGVVESVWLHADKVYAADLAVLDHLPRGAKLAVAYPAGEEHAGAIPLLHLPTLAAARREAFVPTVFAEPAQQPLVLTPAAAALAPLSVAPAWWLTFVNHDPVTRNLLGPALAQYGYIVFLDRKPFDLPPSTCLEKIAAEPRFKLVAIIPGCR